MNLKLFWERFKFMCRMVSGRYPERQLGGLLFMDLRTDRFRDTQQLEIALQEAVDHIAAAKAGFGELVTSYLRQVVATDFQESVSPFAQTYYTTFPAVDRRNTVLLACNLVWAATIIRTMRNQPIWRRRAYWAQAHLHAREARLRFVRQFPNPDEWERYFAGETS
jgi:hypothetical protein